MSSPSWKNAIVDKSNRWFNALEFETQGRLLEALRLYLEDSLDSFKQGAVLPGALDIACAANCLRESGYANEAKMLYLAAAVIHEENADATFAKSLRESIWSMRLSFKYFLLANDLERAQLASHKLSLLTKRIDPFVSDVTTTKDNEMEVLTNHVIAQPKDATPGLKSRSGDLDIKVAEEVQKFLALLYSQNLKMAVDPSSSSSRREEVTLQTVHHGEAKEKGSRMKIGQDIVSQLG
jgi:hypothetical protein